MAYWFYSYLIAYDWWAAIESYVSRDSVKLLFLWLRIWVVFYSWTHWFCRFMNDFFIDLRLHIGLRLENSTLLMRCNYFDVCGCADRTSFITVCLHAIGEQLSKKVEVGHIRFYPWTHWHRQFYEWNIFRKFASLLRLCNGLSLDNRALLLGWHCFDVWARNCLGLIYLDEMVTCCLNAS